VEEMKPFASAVLLQTNCGWGLIVVVVEAVVDYMNPSVYYEGH